jgi:hypothetical protein
MGNLVSAYKVHTQIEELSHLEVSPDTKVVVEVDLTNRHPLKVRTNCVHLARVYTDSAELQKGSLGIVHTTGAITIAVITNLMVVPCCYPSKVLVGKT